MKRLISIGLAAVLSVATVYAAEEAAPPSPEAQAKSAIEARQGLFKVIGFTMGPIGGMLRNKVPFDAEVIAKNSARLETLSTIIPEMFQSDTRQFKAVKTGALDGIWTSQADFKAKADELNKAAVALTAAAKSGDKAATLKAAGAVGKSCGNCHDTFRAK